jgi:hypothetical protein
MNGKLNRCPSLLRLRELRHHCEALIHPFKGLCKLTSLMGNGTQGVQHGTVARLIFQYLHEKCFCLVDLALALKCQGPGEP